MWTEVDDGVVELTVLVVPGASRSEVVGPHGDALRVRVAAAAEKGKANAAVEALLAGALGLPSSAVSVVHGGTNRRKRVRIISADPEAVRAMCAAG